MRLIDAERLCELYTEMKWVSFGDACQAWLAAKVAPTAEKRGRWLKIEKQPHLMRCSVCGSTSVEGDLNYCPRCGAKMDEVEE